MLTSDSKFHHPHHMEGLHEEKKVRVEQVVMALSKGEKRKMVNHKEYEENLKGEEAIQYSPSHTSERPKEFQVEEHEMPKFLSAKRKRKSKDSDLSPPNITPKPVNNSFIPLSEPSAFKPCTTQPHLIRPKILVPCCPVSAPQRHQMPYFPVPRSRGIVIGKKSPNIVKVPRDENSKLIVYDPHNKSKSKDKVKPLSSVKPYNKNGNGSKSPKLLSESQTTSKSKAKSTSPVLDYRKSQSPASEETKSTDVKIEKEKSLRKIDDWSTQDVYEYIRNSDCEKYADIFLEQEVDGKVLPLLDEISISKNLGVKMGPAIRLYSLIKDLKKKCER